jgi:hypothetical protein
VQLTQVQLTQVPLTQVQLTQVPLTRVLWTPVPLTQARRPMRGNHARTAPLLFRQQPWEIHPTQALRFKRPWLQPKVAKSSV